MRFKFTLCYKGMETIQTTTKNRHYFFDVNSLIFFLLQDNAIFPRLELLKL